MKQLFVTYTESNIIKKAVINEVRYKELLASNNISEVVLYPNALIMEQNYSAKCSSGNCSSSQKNILHG